MNVKILEIAYIPMLERVKEVGGFGGVGGQRQAWNKWECGLRGKTTCEQQVIKGDQFAKGQRTMTS